MSNTCHNCFCHRLLIFTFINAPKELSLCYKLKLSNPYILVISWCKPLIFQTQIILSKKIYSLKFLRSMTLGCKYIGIIKSEFVAKTQFLSNENSPLQFTNWWKTENVSAIYLLNGWIGPLSNLGDYQEGYTSSSGQPELNHSPKRTGCPTKYDRSKKTKKSSLNFECIIDFQLFSLRPTFAACMILFLGLAFPKYGLHFLFYQYNQRYFEYKNFVKPSFFSLYKSDRIFPYLR